MSKGSEGKATRPGEVPVAYCDGGSCWRLADRWEWTSRYSMWLAVCDIHGDRIAASERAGAGE